MRKLHFAWLLTSLLALGLAASSPAQAQPHPPMGGGMGAPPSNVAEPKIDQNIAVGTVAVRLVDGDPKKPIAGMQVSLIGGGTTVLVTDAEGQVLFTDLAPGVYRLQASVNGSTLRSEGFKLPSVAGVNVVLTTKPIGPGLGGRPSSRMMSGRARPERGDPAGRLTIRGIQGELKPSEFGGLVGDIPLGATVHLVGIKADGTATVESQTLTQENEGRVHFDNLDRNNRVAYYAMTLIERLGGTDRLMTQAVQIFPQVGARMMLAGEARDSARAGIDDLANAFGGDTGNLPPGEVELRLFAEDSQLEYLRAATKAELLEISSGDVIEQPVENGKPAASDVLGRSTTMDVIEGTQPGEISFYTVRPPSGGVLEKPIPGLTVRIQRADGGEMPAAPEGEEGNPYERVTGEKGTTIFRNLQPGVKYVGVSSIFGSEVQTMPFEVDPAKAQSFAFAFIWPERDIREVRFTGVSSEPGRIYIARLKAKDRVFMSLPFQMTQDKGALIAIFMYPELLFSMHGGAELDDEKMWFQAQMSLANPGVAPVDRGSKGVSIPLPKGFVGASVAEEMSARVKVVSGEGFVWRGAVPPGQRDFISSFAISAEGGEANFDLALPYGMRSGRMVLEDLPGMQLRTPPGAKVVPKKQPNGRVFIELPDIDIAPGQRLVFGLTGLPQHPAWQRWVRNIVGVVAILLVVWALWAIFFSKEASGLDDPRVKELEAQREKLMSQLVQLEVEERHGKGDEKSFKKRRDKLKSKLTEVYAELDELKQTGKGKAA